MNKTESSNKHKNKIGHLYRNPKYNNAIDLWASFFFKSEDEVHYSNWRYLNKKRQHIENSIWRKYLKDGDSILDIACGNGYFLKRIHDIFQNNIANFALDISSEVINVAKVSFPAANYVISTAETMPFQDNQFDYIQIIGALANVINPVSVIADAVRVLKPGGILYIVVHKYAVDPLIFPTLYQTLYQMAKYRFNRLFNKLCNKKEGKGSVNYSFKLSDFRGKIFHSLKKNNMFLLEKGFLVGHIEPSFYQGIGLRLNWFLSIAKLANVLPFGIFKDLEYYLYKKEG